MRKKNVEDRFTKAQGLKAMRHAAVASFCFVLFTGNALANAGFFSGSGQTITLTRTEQVQLVSEDVTMTPRCGFNIETDSVDFRCKFVLKSLSTKPVKIQVGFPLDSQWMKFDKDNRKETDLVLDYCFIVRDEDRTYHVRYVPSDSQRKFFHLFVWDMEFKSGETKLLRVAYQLPMSMALSSMTKPDVPDRLGSTRRTEELSPSGTKRAAAKPASHDEEYYLYPEPLWHTYPENGLVEWFQYITETGKSWAGPIEKATFRAQTEYVPFCLGQRALLGGGEPPEPMRKGVVYQDISPEGGKFDAKEGTTTWEYKNYKPGKPFCIRYYLVGLPPTAADCDSWVRLLLDNKPNNADLADMREVVAAFYGIAPRSDSAKQFVERQVWYHPKKGLQEAGLTAEQRAILARLDAKTDDRRPTKIWARTGPLGETPKRVTDALPLSDQANKNGWVKFAPMTDEFNGKELDRSKWVVGLEWWKGRQPALFSEKNVAVSDGKLHLTMRKEKLPPDIEKQGYKDYTSAALHSKARTAYGYFEVKAKPMNSAGSSSFWFHKEDTPNWATEIDVFEIGGKSKAWERQYNMNLHVFQTPQEKKHWDVQHTWIAPWRLADNYHVYGLDWGKDEIKYFVDGVVVRSVENTHWHQPLYLTFDSETMPDWFGMPKDEDLPSAFSVEYVRAWKTRAK